MPPDEFERLMARHYAARGYRVDHSGTGARSSSRRFDGGIDLKLYRDGEYIVVQCKRETADEVTHNVVHQLIGVMHTQRATGAIVVNTGEYSRAAIEAASKIPEIQLIDGIELRRMLAETGDLPTTGRADDILAAMAGSNHRRTGHDASREPSWAKRKKSAVGLITFALTVAILCLGYFVWVPRILNNMAADITQGVQRSAAHRASPQPRPATWSAGTPVATPRINSTPAYHAPDATTPPPPALTKLSKKESEEWDRKNAESMRILEKTTKSLD
jgi:hypothetical protein